MLTDNYGWRGCLRAENGVTTLARYGASHSRWSATIGWCSTTSPPARWSTSSSARLRSSLIDEPGEARRAARVRAFAQFIRLYRRYARRHVAEDDGGWIEAPPCGRPCGSAAVAVRSLPIELREALLLVVLADFSHCEAAAALDVPLAAVIERLARARGRMSLQIGGARDAEAAWPQSAHLRVVK